MTTQEQHTLSSVIYMTRQLGRKPCLRDAMTVLDEGNLKHDSATKHAASATSTSTSLAPGPMELSAIASAGSKSDQCARCKGYGHWSPACGTPRNWKRGDPITGRPPGGNASSGRSAPGGGSTPSGAIGEKGKPWGRSGKSQAHNTEAEDAQDENRDSGSEGEEAAIEVSLREVRETPGNQLRSNLSIISPRRSPPHRTRYPHTLRPLHTPMGLRRQPQICSSRPRRQDASRGRHSQDK